MSGKILAVGGQHSCAVTKDNKVLCWGYNADGQLGDDSNSDRDHPVYVIDGDGSSTHLTDIIEVAAGENGTCALKSSGEVLCWGVQAMEQLGNGETTNKNHPVSVKESEANSASNLSGIIQINGGGYHTCALNEGGKVLCWGKNRSGQLGNGATVEANESYPVFVHESESSSNHLTNIVQIKGGLYHTCALSSVGGAYCWGAGNYGQLGSSDETYFHEGDGEYYGVNRHAPLAVLVEDQGIPLNNIAEIGPGGSVHSCALLKEGGVKCWGLSSSGRLGNGSTAFASHYFPLDVLAESGSGNLAGMVKLSSANQNNCGLSSNGEVKCWGYGAWGKDGQWS